MAKAKKISNESNGSAYVSRGMCAGVYTTTAGVTVGNVVVKAEWSQYDATDARTNALAKLQSRLLEALDEVTALMRDVNSEGM